MTIGPRKLRVLDLPSLFGDMLPRLPYVLRLLAENHLRAGGSLPELLRAMRERQPDFEFTFQPNRLLMHDTTCTPALADVAGLRDALAEAGKDPAVLSPTLPVDVSVDHSLAVDAFAVPDAIAVNARNEFARNSERYAFMKWASRVMDSVRVHPPGTGIMHTINLEQLATVLEIAADGTAHPDMMLGTDSHTPMINGIGVLAWGVGGLEAETVMFGQTASLAMPRTVGVRLSGQLSGGSLATDLALEVTHRLRKLDVTGDFVEFFGPGVASLSADARSVVANMAPEYGAATGYFPVDEQVVAYLERTGRPANLLRSIEPVFRAMGLWFDPLAEPDFDRTIDIDLSEIRPVISGPRRPQDRCAPCDATRRIEEAIARPLADRSGVPDGAVGIAAITSCTNTSDPGLLIAAGLLARAAKARGLKPAPWVKTSLAPGSPSARAMLNRSGLDTDLSALGFDVVGYGCTTCIGNSGALPDSIDTALSDGKAICAVLSGNRNFPGRVHPRLDLAYLASPPLVVAYAIKGDVLGDITKDPIGVDENGQKVFLADLWPTDHDIAKTLDATFKTSDVPQSFRDASRSAVWEAIKTPDSACFSWDPASRYLRRPKFAARSPSRLGQFEAQALMVLGDDITTDHISPAGAIAQDSAAARWLVEQGGDLDNLNVYAAYRGNWEVMLRGLFTNRLVRNHLQDGLAPAETVLDDGRVLPVFEAAAELAEAGQNAVLFAGERYGMGSSRDWAAKGVALLGVRAVIARSFERIHRTNLIGMGILPLQISDDSIPAKIGLTAADRICVDMPASKLTVRSQTLVRIKRHDGTTISLSCQAAVETEQEVALLVEGGVLPSILERYLG
ncbi:MULTISPECIES: aconitate hydratase AcnA [unclassified Ruegeria]|uniref:aconitate hydratase AcnA n=1 Tax=unclassified Ruegeria TaxID=2625375 RepID=UPI001489A7C1